MLPALLHRKLPAVLREAMTTREDAVTAVVFGTLKILPWADGLGPWLTSLGLPGTEAGTINFWPSMGDTEPDLLLRGKDWAVLIEAKVGADFGPQQLGREWRILRELPGVRTLRLVTVTADDLSERQVLRMVERDLRIREDEGRGPVGGEVCCIRWQDLLANIDERREDVRGDLQAYLEDAGLWRESFEGFEHVHPPRFSEAGKEKSSMSETHAAVAPTLKFLTDYYAQLDRMLTDVTQHLLSATPAWQRVRRLGPTYESRCEVKVGQPASFLARELCHFYVPADAFPDGRVYGVDASQITRVAYAAVWLGDEDNSPELFGGWFEGLSLSGDKNLEGHIRAIYECLDPGETLPPQQVTGLEGLSFEPRPLRGHPGGWRLAMGRVALADMGGPADVERFSLGLLQALGAV